MGCLIVILHNVVRVSYRIDISFGILAMSEFVGGVDTHKVTGLLVSFHCMQCDVMTIMASLKW